MDNLQVKINDSVTSVFEALNSIDHCLTKFENESCDDSGNYLHTQLLLFIF